jgi:hypothetical protein
MREARTPMLQVALNGGRTPGEHPFIPRTPDALAREARASAVQNPTRGCLREHTGDRNGSIGAHR